MKIYMFFEKCARKSGIIVQNGEETIKFQNALLLKEAKIAGPFFVAGEQLVQNIKEQIEEVESFMMKDKPVFSGDVLTAFNISTFSLNLSALRIISFFLIVISLAFQIVFSLAFTDIDDYIGGARQVLMLNRLVLSAVALVFLVLTSSKLRKILPEALLYSMVWIMPVFYLWVMALFSTTLVSLDVGLVPYLGMQFFIVALMRFSLRQALLILVPPILSIILYELQMDDSTLKIAVYWVSAIMAGTVSVILSQILFSLWKRQFHFIVTIRRQSDELTAANEKLKRLAEIDGLTGISNRRSFDEKIQYEWARARREHEKLALIMIDIDHFKRYNDRYGHQKGDDTLKAVALTIQKTLRRSIDFAARYGGEEFVVLLPMATMDGACEIAEKIREAVFLMKIEHGESEFGVATISLGVSCLGQDDTSDYAALISEADRSLYDAKKAGRNRFVCAAGAKTD